MLKYFKIQETEVLHVINVYNINAEQIKHLH